MNPKCFYGSICGVKIPILDSAVSDLSDEDKVGPRPAFDTDFEGTSRTVLAR